MAERRAGPVKPPVIDLTARQTVPEPPPERQAEAPADPVVERAAPPPPRREPEPAASTTPPVRPVPWLWLAGAAVGGAVLGTLLTFLFANVVALPSPIAPLPDPGPRLLAAETAADALEERLGQLEKRTGNTQISLDSTIAQLDSGLNETRQSIADVKAAIPPPVTVDLSGIDTELKTMKARIDAIAAGASATEADALSQSLAALEADIGTLTTRLAGIDGRLNASDTTLTALRGDIDAARKALNDHIATALQSEVGPAVKLPLILSGLDSAFAEGRPFATELAGLAAILPGMAVPSELSAIAATGLPLPDTLATALEARVPDMLAAAPDAGHGDWGQSALGWLKSLLALRPVGEAEGQSPDAVVSRLEGAVARHDFLTAETLFQQLPPAMQAAAGTAAAGIALHAEAAQLLADLRAKALGAPTAGAAQ